MMHRHDLCAWPLREQIVRSYLLIWLLFAKKAGGTVSLLLLFLYCHPRRNFRSRMLKKIPSPSLACEVGVRHSTVRVIFFVLLGRLV